MSTVNIHEAKTHLSKLIEKASKGESFVIAKSGRPVVKVSAVGAPAAVKRLGVLAGEVAVPEDRMGQARFTALAIKRGLGRADFRVEPRGAGS